MNKPDEQNLGRLVSAIYDGDGEAGEELLARMGFAAPAAAFENLCQIVQPLGPGEQAEMLVALLMETLLESADPDMALVNWERLFTAAFSRAGMASLLLDDPQFAELLSRLFGHSQFLADILVLNPEYVEWLRSPEAQSEKRLATYEQEMAQQISLFHEAPSQRNALCRYHRRELLRIGLRDMMGWATLETVTAELSDLAQATIRTALSLCESRLQARFGRPLGDDGHSPCGFAVIALGKLGAGELNYSSDVDLMFVYEAPGQTAGQTDSTGHQMGSISNQEYFAKLGAELIEFLSHHGPEGHLYRIDMRLRPEGKSGALAHSFAACQGYYLERARLWERVALLRARGIAGDPPLIEQFENLAVGFVFAPTMPQILLAEIAQLKHRIDYEVLVSHYADREIKRGRGGIREVEFIIAVFTILYGEQRPPLRRRATLDAIAALADAGILNAQDGHLLNSAYRFFRRIEHALQCVAWRQVHLIPIDPREQAALAWRCGIRAGTRAEAAQLFNGERARLANAVRDMFDDVFRRESRQIAVEQQSPLRLLDDTLPAEQTRRLLARWRLNDPALAESLKRLARGTHDLPLSALGQRCFERLLPALLESCLRVPWPENAVRYLEAFVRASGNATGYYQVLDENRPVFDLLLRLFGTSSFLAERLIANPGWFDILIAPDTFGPPLEWLGRADSDWVLQTGREPAQRLQTLRELAFLSSLRIGLRYIAALDDSATTARNLTVLGESCVRASLIWAVDDTIGEGNRADPSSFPLTILGLGKLGRRELIFQSDLDLVFVANETGHTASPGIGTRVAERLIFYLTDSSHGGAAFRVDARLRPEGSASPLVTTLAGLKRHFERRAEVWEIQTYLGARTVAGNAQLGDAALQTVFDAAASLGSREAIAQAMRSMRARLEASVRLPPWASADFKRGRGGLVDLEFLAQYLQLLHVANQPALAAATPREVFQAAAKEGWLGPSDADALLQDYEFLRRLENNVRLVLETPQTCFPADPARLEALVRAPQGSWPSGQSLRREFEQRSQRVREMFTAIVQGETP